MTKATGHASLERWSPLLITSWKELLTIILHQPYPFVHPPTHLSTMHPPVRPSATPSFHLLIRNACHCADDQSCRDDSETLPMSCPHGAQDLVQQSLGVCEFNMCGLEYV